ncbi:MAG: COX15/CtaA family protein [Dehalococcoidia bacterium]
MVKAITSVASGERGAAAWSQRLRALLDIRYLSVLTVLCTYALIVLGATVRVTDSGLACPDWPRCHGQIIPPMETKVWIEFSHRLAAMSVGFMIAGLAASVWLWHREKRAVVVTVTLAVAVLIVQVLLGGATVNMELPETIVALHLATALVLLTLLILTSVLAISWWRVAVRAEDARLSFGPFAALLAAAAAATFALILIGSYVANSGASLVYPDWPLFDGKLTSAGGRLADLHYAHRLMAAGVGLLLGVALVQAWRERVGAVQWVMAGALALFTAEVFVGASNIWLDMPEEVRIAHLALAAAVWSLLVLAGARYFVESALGEARVS